MLLAQQPTPFTREDFSYSPMLVFYEVTRACDMVCKHCRADAQKTCHPDELNTTSARRLIDQLLDFPKRPMLVFTGGDPIKRADIFELIDHSVSRGITTALTPSPTPLVTSQTLVRLKAAGLHRLAVSLDGADAFTHDHWRRTPGSFARTLEILTDARALGLSVQVNTTVSRANLHQLGRIAELLEPYGIAMWSVFFLVPTGRAQAQQRLQGPEVKAAFTELYRQSAIRRFPIKTTEAPHYRRFVLQQETQAKRAAPTGQACACGGGGGHGHGESHAHEHADTHEPGHTCCGRGDGSCRGQSSAPATAATLSMRPRLPGTNDGRGVMFVSHVGEIFPSGFLPIECGRFPRDNLKHVYQNATLFKQLRDPGAIGGKCGVCEFRCVCGGSRARAFALTGDPLAPEPDCSYTPAGYGGMTNTQGTDDQT
ncbi:MAG: radical SAM protein [Phycisphaerae bacterium]